MGVNYNYLLFFKHNRLWDVLLGLAEIYDTEGVSPTTIHFPGLDLVLPLMSNWGQSIEHAFDKPRYKFATSMTFDEDEAILD